MTKRTYIDMDGRQQQLRLQNELDLINQNSLSQFNGIEPRNCAAFGCGKILTITEAMAGTKCLRCQGNKETIFKHYKL